MSESLERVGLGRGGLGGLVRIRDTSAVHAGTALALLKARWEGDEAAARTIVGATDGDELLRSALALVIHMADAAYGGPEATRDNLHRMARTYQRRGRLRMQRLCRGLADWDRQLCHGLVIEEVDATAVIDLCQSIVSAVEVRHGVPAQMQFDVFLQDLARLRSR